MIPGIAGLFIVAVAAAGLLAAISVWAPRRLWVKIAAVSVAAIFLPLIYTAFADLLSKPKPVDLEWGYRNIPEATVLAASLREGEGIYLWLQFDGVDEPRAYVMPWDRKVAQALQDAQRRAKENNAGLRMRRPFDLSLDQLDRLFYPAPQPMLPPKPVPDDGPLTYERPGSDV